MVPTSMLNTLKAGAGSRLCGDSDYDFRCKVSLKVSHKTNKNLLILQIIHATRTSTAVDSSCAGHDRCLDFMLLRQPICRFECPRRHLIGQYFPMLINARARSSQKRFCVGFIAAHDKRNGKGSNKVIAGHELNVWDHRQYLIGSAEIMC